MTTPHVTDAEFKSNADRVNSDDFESAANCGRALTILHNRIRALEAAAQTIRGSWREDGGWSCLCPDHERGAAHEALRAVTAERDALAAELAKLTAIVETHAATCGARAVAGSDIEDAFTLTFLAVQKREVDEMRAERDQLRRETKLLRSAVHSIGDIETWHSSQREIELLRVAVKTLGDALDGEMNGEGVKCDNAATVLAEIDKALARTAPGTP